jgi:hypothetical protein
MNYNNSLHNRIGNLEKELKDIKLMLNSSSLQLKEKEEINFKQWINDYCTKTANSGFIYKDKTYLNALELFEVYESFKDEPLIV